MNFPEGNTHLPVTKYQRVLLSNAKVSKITKVTNVSDTKGYVDEC